MPRFEIMTAGDVPQPKPTGRRAEILNEYMSYIEQRGWQANASGGRNDASRAETPGGSCRAGWHEPDRKAQRLGYLLLDEAEARSTAEGSLSSRTASQSPLQ